MPRTHEPTLTVQVRALWLSHDTNTGQFIIDRRIAAVAPGARLVRPPHADRDIQADNHRAKPHPEPRGPAVGHEVEDERADLSGADHRGDENDVAKQDPTQDGETIQDEDLIAREDGKSAEINDEAPNEQNEPPDDHGADGAEESGTVGAVLEMWASPVVGNLDLLGADLQTESAPWRDLLLGAPVSLIESADRSVQLPLADRSTLQEIKGRLLAQSSVESVPLRVLGEMFGELGQDDDRVWGLRRARLVLAEADPLTHSVSSAMRSTLDSEPDLIREQTPAAVGGYSSSSLTLSPNSPSRTAAGAAHSLARRITVIDSRGVQIGNHNLQINRFIAQADMLEIDLTRVLATSRVRDAIEALQDNPADTRLRLNLAQAMAEHGFRSTPTPTPLQVVPAEPGLLDFLIKLIFVDSAQIGDRNVQRNRFEYLIPKQDAAELMRHDPSLALAVVDYVCSTDHTPEHLRTLESRFRHVVKNSPFAYPSSRTRGIQTDHPRVGEHLIAYSIDGLSVGHTNRQRNHEKRTVSSVRIRGDKVLRDSVKPIPEAEVEANPIGGIGRSKGLERVRELESIIDKSPSELYGAAIERTHHARQIEEPQIGAINVRLRRS